MATTVEIGFNIIDPDGNFAVLDDNVKGVLGSTTYVLAGFTYYDVTESVTSVGISRGKSRQLDRYSAGQASVTFNNNDRRFDPLYGDSPYAGQIVPRRDIRITSNGIIQYQGVIDDWNLAYQPQGNSTAELSASDGFAILAGQTIPAGTATSQLSGARVNAILDKASVNWPAAAREIETGTQTLQADVIEDNTDVLGYFDLITNSESGSIFISRTGNVVFKDREFTFDLNQATKLSDDGTGIPYQAIGVVYGSELLYNEIVVSRAGGGTATASDIDSQRDYGISVLKLENLLLNSDSQNTDLADHLIAKYAQPEYRFETMTVDLTSLREAQQNEILGLELGDLVRVVFTPNGVAPAIEQFAEIIKIDHSIDPAYHLVNLGFAAADFGYFTLSNARFGRLTRGNILL